MTVGGRELIDYATLLVPSGEDAWVEFTADTSPVKIKISFIDDKEDPETGYALTGAGDHAILTIRNWNNALPMCIEHPFHFGEEDGRGIYLQFIGDSVGSLKRIELAFFWEASQ
ncbi:DUF6864 domain-containing function [Synechococcus sp. HK01-R]|uniref:DUF6864 domain-containing function n=1 Tax=Synechococcus sp. HK01-R TaxID=2751171 RepID=UPI00351B9F40